MIDTPIRKSQNDRTVWKVSWFSRWSRVLQLTSEGAIETLQLSSSNSDSSSTVGIFVSTVQAKKVVSEIWEQLELFIAN